MTLALFAHFIGPATDPAELQNLAGLAENLRGLGYQPKLVIGASVAIDAAAIPFGAAFDAISVASLANAGDGAEAMRGLIAQEVASLAPQAVIALASLGNRNWAPQIAAAQDADFIGNAEKIEGTASALSVTAPVMGGLLKKQVVLQGALKVVLYSGEALTCTAATAAAQVITAPATGLNLLESEALPDAGGLPLRGAAKVVSGGLGIGSAENWSLVEAFAQATESAVGASRAAVDMGWVPSSRQVGFSGKKVAPDVYVAIGISGAVQHLAGIVGARKIVAINSDPEAPIFKIADISIIGDYQAVLKAGMEKLGRA